MERAAAFFRRRRENHWGRRRDGEEEEGAEDAGGKDQGRGTEGKEGGEEEGQEEEEEEDYLTAVSGVARMVCASYRKSSVYNAELVPPLPPPADDLDLLPLGEEQVDADTAGRLRRRRWRVQPRYYTMREVARLQVGSYTYSYCSPRHPPQSKRSSVDLNARLML